MCTRPAVGYPLRQSGNDLYLCCATVYALNPLTGDRYRNFRLPGKQAASITLEITAPSIGTQIQSYVYMPGPGGSSAVPGAPQYSIQFNNPLTPADRLISLSRQTCKVSWRRIFALIIFPSSTCNLWIGWRYTPTHERLFNVDLMRSLTCTGASFSSTDVNKGVAVVGAGAAGLCCIHRLRGTPVLHRLRSATLRLPL